MTTTDLPRRPTALSRRHLLAPLPAAAFAVLLGLSGAPAAHAATTEPAEPELTLVAAAQGVLHPGSALTTTLTIENPSDTALEGETAVLELGTAPLADRAQLRSWLGDAATGAEDGSGGDADESADPELTTIGTASGDDIDPGQTDTVGITVDADNDELQSLEPGVYPLRARYGEATADSVVVVGDEDRDEPVGVILPITAPSPGAGLLDAESLSRLTAPDGALTAQLEAAGSGTILAVDPAIPAAIRALGETAPQSAVEWLDRLMLMPNDRFALQFGDADVASQLQAGRERPLRPISLEGYLADEPQQPTPTPTPTQTVASVDPDDDAGEPDLEELLDIGAAQGPIYWPVPGSATAKVIDALAAGDDGAATLTPSDATEQGADGSAVPARGATRGGGSALVYDAGASAALDEVAAARDETARSAAAVAASAELWFAGDEAGDAPLLVALERGAGTRPPAADEDAADEDGADETPADLEAQLSDAIDVVTVGSGVTTQRLQDLLDAAPRRITPAAAEPDEARTALVDEIARSEARVAETATVLETPEILTGIVRAEALQALGVGWHDRPEAWKDAVTAFRDRTRERADAVGIQDPTPVQLVSAGADLPVWIRNDLPYPVTVTLIARPSDPRLDVADETTVTAQPSSSTAVPVQVEARVGSGQVDIDLTLVSPTGAQIGTTKTVDVTVRADWERIGIGVLLALIAGLLIVGVFRTIRRRRRATAEAGPAAGVDGNAADGAEPAPHHETEDPHA